MSAKNEYSRYLAWLHAQSVSEDGKRVAQIVFDNFDRIARTSSNQSQRTRILVPLLEQQLAAAQALRFEPPADSTRAPQSWIRLRQLVVGPFRGFREPETFALDKPIVLVYGPNGTGKSSFCEALEFALLGSVDEASARRIPQDSYLRNVHAKLYSAPVLTATGPDGAELKVTPDLESYRFCFIEKNRIEAFSRLGARTPAQRAETIAVLFGMEDFLDFVRNFNTDITTLLKLADLKAQELDRKRQTLTGDQATVNGEAAKRASLAADKVSIANAFQEGLPYDLLLGQIGSAEEPGRLQQLQSSLDTVPPAETGVTTDALDALRENAVAGHAAHVGLGEQLEARRAEVNFKSLYEALQGLEYEGLDVCPACATPLNGPDAVRENPFDRARKGLAELEELATLQEQHATAALVARRTSGSLAAYLRRIVDLARGPDPAQPWISELSRLLFGLGTDPEGNWWTQLDAQPDFVTGLWEAARREAQRAQESDANVREMLAKRQSDIAERDRLLAVQQKTYEVARRELNLSELTAAAKMRIDKFCEENVALIEEVKAEKAAIVSHQRILTAYNAFLGSLSRYKDELPRALTADLSATAIAFYNAFNRNDHEADKLSKLILPVTNNERISITFNSHPDDTQDALQVMSEGHVRCLGLAILVAKNVKLNSPLLIFDDAVNAIDDEHRGGIRDTLFDESMIGQKQVILTCHGEELIKDIEVFIGHKRAEKECLTYTFLPHDGDRLIRIDPGKTRNYIATALLAFKGGRIREAIGESRRATEAVCQRTWRFLAKCGFGELQLKMERNRQPIESYDLATQLKKKIDLKDFHHPDKTRLSEGFVQMLARWSLLNLGTHEEAERKDFPRADVKGLIDNLAMLDDVLTQKTGGKAHGAAASAPPLQSEESKASAAEG